MKPGAIAAPSSAAVAALLLIALGACSGGSQHAEGSAAPSSTGSAAAGSATPGSPGSTAPGSAAAGVPGAPGTPGTAAAPTVGWTVIEPSVSMAPASSRATSDRAAFPSASEYPMSSTQGVYSIAGSGVSGSVEYVDAYSVEYVCGAGIADDCDRYIGTPEYRIPLAAGARILLLGTDMQPNRAVDFAAFQSYAAGSDGAYDGNYDYFVITFTGPHQAASLTAVYSP